MCRGATRYAANGCWCRNSRSHSPPRTLSREKREPRHRGAVVLQVLALKRPRALTQVVCVHDAEAHALLPEPPKALASFRKKLFDSKRLAGGSHLDPPALQPGLGDTREAAHADPVVPDDLIVQVPQHPAYTLEFRPDTLARAYVGHVLVHRRVVLIRLRPVHVEIQQRRVTAAARIGFSWCSRPYEKHVGPVAPRSAPRRLRLRGSHRPNTRSPA